MQRHPNTTQNSPATGITIHPSGMVTTDHHPSEVYEPNALQIESAARRALGKEPLGSRRQISPLRFFLAASALLALAYWGTYFVLSKVLGS